MKPPLNPNAAAILVWLPKGDRPTVHAFSAAATAGHPSIQPIAFWRVSDALHAVETDEGHPDEDPWIKVGDVLFGRDEIHDLYRTALALSERAREQGDDDGA